MTRTTSAGVKYMNNNGLKLLKEKIACTLSVCKQLLFEVNVVTQVSESERPL